MKKVLLTLLGIIVVVGVLAGAGFAGYRIGYSQGALATSDGTTQLIPGGRGPGLQGMPMHNFGIQRMPLHNFRGFERGIGPGGFGMMNRGMGFNFFSPFHFIVRLASFGLIIWLAYRLFKGNGWNFSLTRQTVEPPKVENDTTDQAG